MRAPHNRSEDEATSRAYLTHPKNRGSYLIGSSVLRASSPPPASGICISHADGSDSVQTCDILTESGDQLPKEGSAQARKTIITPIDAAMASARMAVCEGKELRSATAPYAKLDGGACTRTAHSAMHDEFLVKADTVDAPYAHCPKPADLNHAFSHPASTGRYL